MAIDPPYRLSPFQNIINVHWESATEEPTGGYGPIGLVYFGFTVGVLYTALNGSAHVLEPGGVAKGWIDDVHYIPLTISGSLGFTGGSWTGHGTNITADAEGTSVNWQVLGSDGGIIGGPWTADASGLNIRVDFNDIHGDFSVEYVEVGPLQSGGPAPMNYSFSVKCYLTLP